MIRPELVPSAYREDLKADTKTDVKKFAVKTTLYTGKGIYGKNGFKRK
jgi:hypothetical protein